jgi:tetratricopeptide (TPR) repeat protein
MNLTERDIEQACALVSDLIYAGQFEEARAELGILWYEPDEDSELVLSQQAKAEILLQRGALTGWLGSAKQRDEQEEAKNLITQALEIFESRGNQIKIAEAQYELGICYWRTGALDEARIIFAKAKHIGTYEQRGKILVAQALVEYSSGRHYESLMMLDNAQASFERYPPALKGRWHGQRGLALTVLASAETKRDYYDRAIVDYTAASVYLEEAGHHRYRGNILNNLAFILYKTGHYQDAHDHLERARIIFENLKDDGSIAQVDETRARVLLAEKRYVDAEQVIRAVVRTLEKGGEQAVLAEALTTRATVQARRGNKIESVATFKQAIKVGQVAGARCCAGLAAIGLIEEHGKTLSINELYKAYQSADSLLSGVQDLETIQRIRACARIFARRLCERGENFKLSDAVRDYEGHFIEQALAEVGGMVTKAAKLLGLTHQGLAYILDSRQFRFFYKRKPPRERRRSIMKKEKPPASR